MKQKNIKELLLVMSISLIFFVALAGCRQKREKEITFPKEKAIRIMSPYGVGGGIDRSSRILASVATKVLRQRIDVISMPGAGGQEAINFVMEQPADGYTLLITDYGPLITTALTEKVNYELFDWTPVFQINEVEPVFFTRADSPIRNVEDWIATLKLSPESLSVGHGRYLSVPHLPLILFEIQAGIKNIHVPTTGGSEALAFVLGKKVDLGASVPSTIAPSVKSGELRVLALCSAERVSSLPDTPTLKELGYDVALPVWYTIFALKDVPEERIDLLNEKFSLAMSSESAIYQANQMDIVLSPPKNKVVLQEIYTTTIENLIKILVATGK